MILVEGNIGGEADGLLALGVVDDEPPARPGPEHTADADVGALADGAAEDRPETAGKAAQPDLLEEPETEQGHRIRGRKASVRLVTPATISRWPLVSSNPRVAVHRSRRTGITPHAQETLTGPPSLTVLRTENRPEPPEGVGRWRGGEAGLSGAERFCSAAGGGGGEVCRGRETSG